MAAATAERTAAPGKTLYNVMVRHSPFILKNKDIEAAGPEEAKRLFLEAAKVRCQQRAAKVDENSGLETETIKDTKKAIFLSHEKGMDAERAGQLEWVIRPAADVQAWRAQYSEDREKAWRGK